MPMLCLALSFAVQASLRYGNDQNVIENELVYAWLLCLSVLLVRLYNSNVPKSCTIPWVHMDKEPDQGNTNTGLTRHIYPEACCSGLKTERSAASKTKLWLRIEKCQDGSWWLAPSKKASSRGSHWQQTNSKQRNIVIAYTYLNMQTYLHMFIRVLRTSHRTN